MSTDILWLDIETRSRCDLKKRGAYNYAADPSTQVLVICWAINNGPVKTWQLLSYKAVNAEFVNAYNNPKVQKRAHNAGFERLVLGKAIGPRPVEEWYCTATQARACSLPGALDTLSMALDLDHKKSKRGNELIRLLSIPRPDGSFLEDPHLMKEFADYCADDVRAMRDLSNALTPLTDEALELYHINERINDRGLPIDTELCQLATGYAEREAEEANAVVQVVSQGALRTAKGPKLTQWLYDHFPKHAQNAMVKHKTVDGVDKRSLSLDADIRGQLLDMVAENPDEYDSDAVTILEAAEAAAMSSVSKFQTMLDRAGDDARVRGAFITNGAAQTGRFSSTGAQMHNFSRTVAKDPEAIIAQMRAGADFKDQTLATLKSMLRPAIASPRGTIIRGDWSAVEARGLPWLVNSRGSLSYLEAFNDKSRDIYVEQSHAAGLGGARQPGKVVVLSLGYGGGPNALLRMAKGYSVHIDAPDATVKLWRGRNGWAVRWWKELVDAAKSAIVADLQGSAGKQFHAGRITFACHGGWLVMQLPCGRCIYYPFAKLVEGKFGTDIEHMKAAWKPKANATEWPRARLWHGTLAENGTQCTCASLLRDSLVRGWKQGLPIIGHVHDEVILEYPGRGKKAVEAMQRELERCMLTVPEWAEGFPLAVETAAARRFGK